MINIAIPSKGRAKKVETLALFDDISNVTIFVNTEEEKALYETFNKCKVVATNSHGIAAARNRILDYYGEGDMVLQLCDDIQGVYYKDDRTKNSHKKLTNAQLIRFIENGFKICQNEGAKMWGIHPCAGGGIMLKHKMMYKHFIIGTFSGYIVDDIRCDERMKLKEDYDFTAKHIKKYGKVVRFDNLHPCARHYVNEGGAVEYRNAENEQASIAILKELHPEYFIDNVKRVNEVLFKVKCKNAEKGKLISISELVGA